MDLLNKEKIQLLGGSNSETVAFVLDKDKRMQVCQICGAMQAACDTEKKLASHYDGKLHIVRVFSSFGAGKDKGFHH